MIPHMAHLYTSCFFFSTQPSLFTCLPRAIAERAGGHVLGDRRAGGDVGALADRDRRDQLRVAADERAVLDRRLMLRLAVVVAGDRAGADVDLLADHRVAEIGEVVGLRAAAERGLLQLDEVADVRVLADVRLRPDVRERPELARRGRRANR